MKGRRGWPGAVLIALVVTAPAIGQPRADEQAAADVVMRQLEAFRRGDFDAAYTFASSEIHHVYDRQSFAEMVQGGYPEIARSTHAFVSRAREAPSGYLYLYVTVLGANGNRVEALYELVREEGEWKINGVVTKPDDGERAAR